MTILDDICQMASPAWNRWSEDGNLPGKSSRLAVDLILMSWQMLLSSFLGHCKKIHYKFRRTFFGTFLAIQRPIISEVYLFSMRMTAKTFVVFLQVNGIRKAKARNQLHGPVSSTIYSSTIAL